MKSNRNVTIYGPNKAIKINNDKPLIVICGPCVIENYDFAMYTAEKLKFIFKKFEIDFIYKSSFDKANRSSIESFRGVGVEKGLKILKKVRNEIGVPVLTDVHTQDQVKSVAEVVDMLQTPAFLCRQTDFIQAAASAGKPVNIKKGQFLAPWDMKNVLDKAKAAGNEQIAICERGTTFGYGNLVVDMKSLSIMSDYGNPVIFDATHSVQLPGGKGTSSDGQRQYVPTLAKAATAIGIAGLFLEAHPEPDRAPSDGPNMLGFEGLEKLLTQVNEFDKLAKGEI